MNLPIIIDINTIGKVSISKIESSDIKEVTELIYDVYQHEKIWSEYTKEQIFQDISAAFTNVPAYRPTYYIARIDKKIIGIAGFTEAFMSSDAFELSFATILPLYQRKGLGTLLTKLRLQEILTLKHNPVIFTRTRAPKLFESFNFKYIYKTTDTDGVKGSFDYMFCKGNEISFPTEKLHTQ